MRLRKFLLVFLAFAILLSLPGAAVGEASAGAARETKEENEDFIKWVEFDVPYAALKKAMDLDIASQNTDRPISWIDLLAGLATQYWGSWKKFKAADLDKLAEKLKSGTPNEEIYAAYPCYGYYREAYDAVLSGFLGSFQIETSRSEGGEPVYETKYGLKVFSPIAKGYYFTHCHDFGTSRSYGFSRRHLGNDLMGSVGTPVIAVESGVVEALGWNQYGGWRIGIRSLDGRRYYYYAHLRKNWPYVKTLQEGQTVTAGDVIGYLGRTGYSHNENVNNIKTPHLHFGMQLIFDESQKECNSEIWIDVYELVELLSRHQSAVVKDPETKEYHRVYSMIDPEVQASEGKA